MASSTSGKAAGSVAAVKVAFEVFGKVQGVFFRKNTKLFADELGLSGWVQNTAHKTVIGEVVGSPESVESMKDWLENVGSKRSVIERAEFSEPEPATAPPAASFVIKR